MKLQPEIKEKLGEKSEILVFINQDQIDTLIRYRDALDILWRGIHKDADMYRGSEARLSSNRWLSDREKLFGHYQEVTAFINKHTKLLAQ